MGKTGPFEWKRHSLVVLFLVVCCIGFYARTVWFPFLAYDDNYYVTENSMVLSGLTVDGVWWALTTGYYANWHPLTWISLQFDAMLGNGSPVAFRTTQVVLHASTVAIVYLIFSKLGNLGVAFVASCFYAIHPLHVESVTWIAERKGILGTFFLAIATWLYLEHQKHRKTSTFLAFCIAYACSLMSKQMGVMIPFVLPLLHLASDKPFRVQVTSIGGVSDNEPKSASKRWSLRSSFADLALAIQQAVLSNRWLYLVSLAMGVLFTVIAFIAQNATGALQSLDSVPILKRLEMISGGYFAYLVKYFFPFNLSFHYHNYRDGVNVGWLLFLFAALSGLIISAVLCVRKFPRYTAAILWYLVAIFPVIGVVAIGDHLMADRYSDWPLLLIHYCVAAAVVWASENFISDRQLRVGFATVQLKYLPVIGLLVGLAFFSQRHINTRRDSISMLDQALQVDPRNPRAHQLKGLIALNEGDYIASRFHTEEAIKWMPWNSHAYNNLGLIDLEEGDLTNAEDSFRRALEELPGFTDAESNLAMVLTRQGRLSEALSILSSLIQRVPYDEAVNMNLASVYRRLGDDERAFEQYAATIRISPTNAAAWYFYGIVAERLGNVDQAANAYLEAWKLSDATLIEAADALQNLKRANSTPSGSSFIVPKKP